MLNDALRQGFVLAHERIGLVFLDALWKAIWLITTIAALASVAIWFGSALRAFAWQDTGISAANSWIAASLLREFWSASKAEIFGVLTAVLLLSALAWLFLEAFVRSRIIGQRNTKLFFVSGATKAAFLAAAAVVLIPVWMGGAITIALVIFVLLAFFLTLLDTLIRSDAVDLLGTDLIPVTGLVGSLFLFEVMIGASFGIILFAGFLNVAHLVDGFVMLAAAGVAIIFLTLMHSYLLLVRFSAVRVMRRHLVEI
jgi:hypothetical protein